MASAEQQHAIDTILELLEHHRVVMLTGAAGTGKSVVGGALIRKLVLAGRVMVTAISHKSLGQHRETAADLASSLPHGTSPPSTAVFAKFKLDAVWWARVPIGKARKGAPWYNAAGPKFLASPPPHGRHRFIATTHPDSETKVPKP
jgi:hypothetical protein